MWHHHHQKTYIEKHWIIYLLQGIIALLFGAYIMFTTLTETSALAILIAATLLCLAVVEIFNVIYRAKNDGCILLSLVMALIELGTALALYLSPHFEYSFVMQVCLIAGFTLFRSFLQLVSAFHSISDPTDRFMWAVCGICGAVAAFVIFNAGNFPDPNAFIQFFGTYMMIFGVTCLFFAAHNKHEEREAVEIKRAVKAAEKRRALRKPPIVRKISAEFANQARTKSAKHINKKRKD